jgi:type 1 glutamine amidotransferase
MIPDRECGIVVIAMPKHWTRRSALGLFGGGVAWAQGVAREPAARKPNVMLLSGGTDANIERSLTSLAQELESKHGLRCKLLAAYGASDLPVVDVLDDATLVLMYLNGLKLPADQMGAIRGYVNSNKPMVALRTSLTAFENWPEFGPEVLGAKLQYDYGPGSKTEVSVIPQAASQSVMKGLPKQFACRSSLYHVLPLANSATPLLTGTSVGPSDRTERVPNPVAWTRSYKGGRIFYTSLGHPDDFQLPEFQNLLVNGIGWALRR